MLNAGLCWLLGGAAAWQLLASAAEVHDQSSILIPKLSMDQIQVLDHFYRSAVLQLRVAPGRHYPYLDKRVYSWLRASGCFYNPFSVLRCKLGLWFYTSHVDSFSVSCRDTPASFII